MPAMPAEASREARYEADDVQRHEARDQADHRQSRRADDARHGLHLGQASRPARSLLGQARHVERDQAQHAAEDQGDNGNHDQLGQLGVDELRAVGNPFVEHFAQSNT